MKTLLDHIKEAHSLSGAPGRVTGYFARGYYTVKLQFGYALKQAQWGCPPKRAALRR